MQHDKAQMAFELDQLGGGSLCIPSSVDGRVLAYREITALQTSCRSDKQEQLLSFRMTSCVKMLDGYQFL
jgi:hypothetical protein